VSKLTREQAAAFFMLGETTGTSAGGASEEGKFLRVPGTNPFFPMPHGLQGNRFLELMEQRPLEVYVLNTGRVGGKDHIEGSKKVRIPHSSAIVKAIAEGTIEWTDDADFGYQVAASVPGIDAVDGDLLRPRELYQRTGRIDEYTAKVAAIKAERLRVPRNVPRTRPACARRGEIASPNETSHVRNALVASENGCDGGVFFVSPPVGEPA